MLQSISIKKVVALSITLGVIFVVNIAISNTILTVALKTEKQSNSWNSIMVMNSTSLFTSQPSGAFAADAGLPVPGPRPSGDFAADAGLPVPGPRPSGDFAADAGLPVPGPRPSVDIATAGDFLSTRPILVRVVSARDGFPQSPRPTM